MRSTLNPAKKEAFALKKSAVVDAPPQSLKQMLEEHKKEEGEFSRILSLAKDTACPLEDLYGRSVSTDEENDIEFTLLSTRLSRMDRQGNPTWIKIAPLERDARYDNIDRDEAAVLGYEGKISRLARQSGQKKAKRGGKTASSKEGTAESALMGHSRYGGRWEEYYDNANTNNAVPEMQGFGTVRGRKPQPMRGLVRMLLVCAGLGLVYHFLAKLGWVPVLW